MNIGTGKKYLLRLMMEKNVEIACCDDTKSKFENFVLLSIVF